jgi:hypothetical protein
MDFKEEEMFTIGVYGQGVHYLENIKIQSEDLIVSSVRKEYQYGKQ